MRNWRSKAARGDSGWTLIELLIVISIIMILAALALTQYRNSILYAKEAALNSDLFLMRDAIDQYYADKGKYPESLQTLVSESYLRVDPARSVHDVVGYVDDDDRRSAAGATFDADGCL